MKKLKIMTVVGTRPEIIRLSRVLAQLDEHCDHVLVHTGQNYDYELNQIFFDDLSIRKPDFFLDSAAPGNTACQTVGAVIARVDEVLHEVRPDVVAAAHTHSTYGKAWSALGRRLAMQDAPLDIKKPHASVLPRGLVQEMKVARG